MDDGEEGWLTEVLNDASRDFNNLPKWVQELYEEQNSNFNFINEIIRSKFQNIKMGNQIDLKLAENQPRLLFKHKTQI